MKFEPNEILAMGKFNPVKMKLSKFRPSSPITPNIILIFFFWQFLAMEKENLSDHNTQYKVNNTLASNLAYNFVSSDFYGRMTLKKKDMSNKY